MFHAILFVIATAYYYTIEHHKTNEKYFFGTKFNKNINKIQARYIRSTIDIVCSFMRKTRN